MSAHLSDNAYGKSNVRLTKVTRLPGRHELREFSVDIRLRGGFEQCYLTGDNTMVLPTDTMKNTVYALAAQNEVDGPEAFALLLSRHFLEHPQVPHCTSAEIVVRQDRWDRIVDRTTGSEHPWAFVSGGAEKRTSRVARERGAVSLVGGIVDLLVLKTTDSGFVDFIRDAYTTLPDTADRIFATSIKADWTYLPGEHDYNACHASIRAAMLQCFAGHKSLAVQQTLLAMGRAAIDACESIEQVEIWLPNQHRIPINLQPMGLQNCNEIFVTTSEPFGLIGGTVRRGEG